MADDVLSVTRTREQLGIAVARGKTKRRNTKTAILNFQRGNVFVKVDVDIERQLTEDDRERFREMALQNARAFGLSDEQWERRRKLENPIIADVLMAFDPQPDPIPADDDARLAARPLKRLQIDGIAGELRQARRQRSIERLNQILDELACRKSKMAARLAASARLSLLAIERPDVLPFRVE